MQELRQTVQNLLEDIDKKVVEPTHKALSNLFEHQFPESFFYDKRRQHSVFATAFKKFADEIVHKPFDEAIINSGTADTSELSDEAKREADLAIMVKYELMVNTWTKKFKEFFNVYFRETKKLRFLNLELKKQGKSPQICYNYPIALEAIGFHLLGVFGMLILCVELELVSQYIFIEDITMETIPAQLRSMCSSQKLKVDFMQSLEEMLNSNLIGLFLEGGKLYKEMRVTPDSKELKSLYSRKDSLIDEYVRLQTLIDDIKKDLSFMNDVLKRVDSKIEIECPKTPPEDHFDVRCERE